MRSFIIHNTAKKEPKGRISDDKRIIYGRILKDWVFRVHYRTNCLFMLTLVYWDDHCGNLLIALNAFRHMPR